MDFLQNKNYSSLTEFDHQKNSSHHSTELKVDLEQLKIQRQELEEKISNHDSIKSEVNDLMNQLENFEESIKYAKENQNKFFNDVITDLANMSSTSEQISAVENSVINFESENQELEIFLQSQTSLEKQIMNEIMDLECIYEKSKEHHDQLHKKKVLDRERTELENAVAVKSAEAAECRDDLTTAETAVRAESERLVGLQRRCVGCDRTSRRLAAERADREAELAALGADAVERLAVVARAAGAVAEELAGARATLSVRVAERRRAAESLCALQTAGDAETHRWRAAARELTAESGRLTDGLVAASACVAAVVSDNARLAECVSARARRLADLTAEADRLDRRADHERAVHAARRAMSDGDAALLEDELAVTRVTAETARHLVHDARLRRNDRRETFVSS